MDYQLIATTTFGIEAVTAKELRRLGYEDLKLENGKVHCHYKYLVTYSRSCLN